MNADTDIETWHLPHMSNQPNDTMNTRSSSYTGRSHRTMASAFGPYTSDELHEPADRINDRGHAAVVVVSIVGLCVVAGLLVAGVI